MVFDQSREAVFEICKTWTRPEIQKGVSRYYDHFEENKAKHVQLELAEVKSAIAALEERAKTLKKEIKKDKEKKKTLEEVKSNLEQKKGELDRKTKEFKTLPQRVKQLKDDFSKQLKDLMKFIEEVLKIRGHDGRVKEDQLSMLEDLVARFISVNEIAFLGEIVKEAGVEFKMDTDFGAKTFKDFHRMLVYLQISIAGHIVDHAFLATLPSKKQALLSRARVLGTSTTMLATKHDVDVDSCVGFQEFIDAHLIMARGVQAMETHEYHQATKYFLKARQILEAIKGSFGQGDLIAEHAALARAYSSDAWNVPYLLNSHANWKMIAAKTVDKEMKEIATISVASIEEWITKQFGFPSDAKQKDIIKKLTWPRPELPPDFSGMTTGKSPGSRRGGT